MLKDSISTLLPHKYRHFRLLKISTKIVVIEKITPLLKPFSGFRALRVLPFLVEIRGKKRKSGRFAAQINQLCHAKRPPFGCKTIGIDVQNDRFCTFARVGFLHISRRKQRNRHAINRLPLHTHTPQKTDQRFYFSFIDYSQRGWRCKYCTC